MLLPYVNYIKIGLVAAVLAFCGWQQYRIHDLQLALANSKTALSEEKTARAEETRDREHVAREHAEQIASIQADHAAKQQENDNAYRQLQAALDKTRTAERAHTDSVRQSLEAATTRDREGAATDPIACERDRDRLEELGRLASEGLGLLEEGRSLLAERDGQVTYLLKTLANDRRAVEQARGSPTTLPEP